METRNLQTPSIVICQQHFLKFKMPLVILPLTFVVSLVEATLHNGAADTHTDSTNGSCPPWYVPDQGKCSYSHKLPQILNQYQQSAELQVGYCMTVTNSGQVVSPFLYNNRHSILLEMIPSTLFFLAMITFWNECELRLSHWICVPLKYNR